MIDRTIERTIKIPRVRTSDCCRLIFRLGEEPRWEDINSAPDLFPVYPMPPMRRKEYLFSGILIKVSEWINDVVRQVCRVISSPDTYLYSLIFKVDGTLEIQTEVI